MVGELWTPGGTVTAQKEHARPTTQGPTEREARRVAEAARQTEWTKPSFGKELFLGRFRLDLVDPWPTPSPEARAKGEAFLARAAELTERIDGRRIEREARIYDEPVSYTHLRAHETRHDLVCRLLLEK